MNRFDLEQQILKCWNVTEDIDEVTRMLGDKGASVDDILNALISINTLTNSRFEDLFQMFEAGIKQDWIK